MADRPFDEHWAPLISGLITRSPPGQLASVLSACQQLTQAAIPKELLGRACSDHNERGLLAVPLGPEAPAGALGILCEPARQGSRAQRQVPYLDPKTDLVFVVDQEQQECTSVKQHVAKGDLMAELEGLNHRRAAPFRAALQAELDRYVAERFPPATISTGQGHSAAAAYNLGGKEQDGPVELQVAITSRRARPRGFWAGNWSSQWRIVFVPGQAEPAKLTGSIEFASHYAEESNVHFNRRAKKTAAVKETTHPGKFAAEVVAVIKQLEDEVHESTEDSCTSFGVGPLKAMRRVLPLSKQRFDWRPMHQALARDMKDATAKDGVC